jgi:predicted PurR-regulated permease PerM
MTSPIEELGPPEGHQGRLVPVWIERFSRVSWAFLGFAGAATAVVLGLAALREIVIPLVLSGAVAVAFAPLVGRLSRRGVPRGLGALLVMILIMGVVVASVVVVVVSIVDQADELDKRFDAAVVEIQDLIDEANSNELVASLRSGAADAGPSVRDGVASQVGSLLDSAAGFASGLVLGLVLLYYLLKDGSEVVGWASARRTPHAADQTERILTDAGASIRAYFQGRTVLAAVQGVAITIILALMGVPVPVAIGVVNFVGGYVPYLGAFIGGAFAVLMALSEGGVSLALWSLGVVLFVNLVLENLLEPRLMGSSLKMHPIVVLLATVAGGALAGIVGLILAAPVVAIGTNLWRELEASGFFDDPSMSVNRRVTDPEGAGCLGKDIAEPDADSRHSETGEADGREAIA